jgi:small multidrug resistance family-3 protein
MLFQSLVYFVLAGLLEIGGGYLVWLWLREGSSLWVAIAGWRLLMLYGVVPTLQPAHFGRVYAAYGGVFIILALLWGWRIDGVRPDSYDWLGCLLVMTGVVVMMALST